MGDPTKRPTMADVALAAGVSSATVSLALNNDPRISVARRREVRELARELGYHPRLAGRLLRANRTGQIGLVFAGQARALGSDGGFYGPNQAAFIDECEALELGYHIEVCPPPEGGVFTPPRQLAGGLVDGALVAGCGSRELYDWLDNCGKPWVGVWEPASYSVCANSHGCAQQAVQRLAALGHQHIGLVYGPAEYHTHHQTRQGFLDAMGEFGRPVNPEWLVQTPGLRNVRGVQDIVAATDALLTASARPTAVVCSGMGIARVILFRALELGLRAPDDLSVVSTGDAANADLDYPRIAHFRMPIPEMCARAIGMLRRLIDGLTVSPANVVLDPAFVDGRTVAPLPPQTP